MSSAPAETAPPGRRARSSIRIRRSIHFYPPDTQKLRSISAATGGKFQPEGKEIFDAEGESTEYPRVAVAVAVGRWCWSSTSAISCCGGSGYLKWKTREVVEAKPRKGPKKMPVTSSGRRVVDQLQTKNLFEPDSTTRLAARGGFRFVSYSARSAPPLAGAVAQPPTFRPSPRIWASQGCQRPKIDAWGVDPSEWHNLPG